MAVIYFELLSNYIMLPKYVFKQQFVINNPYNQIFSPVHMYLQYVRIFIYMYTLYT